VKHIGTRKKALVEYSGFHCCEVVRYSGVRTYGSASATLSINQHTCVLGKQADTSSWRADKLELIEISSVQGTNLFLNLLSKTFMCLVFHVLYCLFKYPLLQYFVFCFDVYLTFINFSLFIQTVF